MNMKSLLLAAVVALGFMSFAETASAGDRYRRGGSGHSNYSRGDSHHHHRGYVSSRGGHYYGCAPRYNYARCYPGYSGYAAYGYPGYPAYSGYAGYPAYSGYAAYPGYYGGGIALRVGPVVIRGGSSRGYCRY